MTAADDTVIARLRDAIRDGDIATTAEQLRRIPIGIAADGAQPRVIDDDGSRLLPVFLDAASWQAFGLDGQPALLEPDRLRDLLAAATHVDAVLVDPALPTATRIPRTDLLALLASTNTTDADALHPDPALAARVAAPSTPTIAAAWGVRRTVDQHSTPAIAVAADASDDAVARLIAALRRDASLPRDLELVELDEATTTRARIEWTSAIVA